MAMQEEPRHLGNVRSCPTALSNEPLFGITTLSVQMRWSTEGESWTSLQHWKKARLAWVSSGSLAYISACKSPGRESREAIVGMGWGVGLWGLWASGGWC